MANCAGCGQVVDECRDHPRIRITKDASSMHYFCRGEGIPHWAVCPSSGKEYPWHLITEP
ncbi:MAG: hypothetical protein V3V98_01220 [Thermoplasmata archaeon]